MIRKARADESPPENDGNPADEVAAAKARLLEAQPRPDALALIRRYPGPSAIAGFALGLIMGAMPAARRPAMELIKWAGLRLARQYLIGR